MNLQQIKQAIENGDQVCVGSEAYIVTKDNKGQYFIICRLNGYCIGLTWLDGVTLNAKESDIFINDKA